MIFCSVPGKYDPGATIHKPDGDHFHFWTAIYFFRSYTPLHPPLSPRQQFYLAFSVKIIWGSILEELFLFLFHEPIQQSTDTGPRNNWIRATIWAPTLTLLSEEDNSSFSFDLNSIALFIFVCFPLICWLWLKGKQLKPGNNDRGEGGGILQQFKKFIDCSPANSGVT